MPSVAFPELRDRELGLPLSRHPNAVGAGIRFLLTSPNEIASAHVGSTCAEMAAVTASRWPTTDRAVQPAFFDVVRSFPAPHATVTVGDVTLDDAATWPRPN